MKKSIAGILIFASLSGCAAIKTPIPINGSKADGTVILAYERKPFEKPRIDWGVANNAAKARCTAWGYKNAQKFNGEQTQCADSDCIRKLVSITYQCIEK